MAASRITPITPAEVTTPTLPDSWLKVFNESIQENWNKEWQRSIVRLSKLRSAHRGVEILDPAEVKDVFEHAGWTVQTHCYQDPDQWWWVFLPPSRRN